MSYRKLMACLGSLNFLSSESLLVGTLTVSHTIYLRRVRQFCYMNRRVSGSYFETCFVNCQLESSLGVLMGFSLRSAFIYVFSAYDWYQVIDIDLNNIANRQLFIIYTLIIINIMLGLISKFSKCTKKQNYAQITKHFLTHNQTYLERLIAYKGPFLAMQVIKAMVGSQHQNQNIMKASINVLQKCQGQFFPQSYISPIQKFLKQYDSKAYEKIVKGKMPEKKVIPISKKGSITISTWNSTENIEDSYDKLITDLPYECEVTEKGQFAWESNKLTKKKLKAFLNNYFESDEVLVKDNKLYINKSSMLMQQCKMYQKINKFIKNSKKPELVVGGVPEFIKRIFDERLQVSELEDNLQLLPYLNILGPWHYFLKYNINCCLPTHPILAETSPYEVKMLSLMAKDEEAKQLLFKTIISEIEEDKNTLILLDEKNYISLVPILDVFDWEDRKEFEDFNLRESISDILIKQNSQFPTHFETKEKAEEKLRKNTILSIINGMQNPLDTEMIQGNPQLLQFMKKQLMEQQKKRLLDNVLQEKYLDLFLSSQYEKCPVAAFSYSLQCDDIKP